MNYKDQQFPLLVPTIHRSPQEPMWFDAPTHQACADQTQYEMNQHRILAKTLFNFQCQILGAVELLCLSTPCRSRDCEMNTTEASASARLRANLPKLARLLKVSGFLLYVLSQHGCWETSFNATIKQRQRGRSCRTFSTLLCAITGAEQE